MNDAGESSRPLNLGIICYDHAHLKTEQLVHRLLLKNRIGRGRKFELKLLALPFKARPQRAVLFPHRPDHESAVTTRELAEGHGLDFLPCTYDAIPDVCDIYMVAGAGVIPADGIGTKKILNVHPGIIPAARGLDAFKWSVFDSVPLGVTLHFIDHEVDAGEIVAIVPTPIFADDSLDTLARRHYELELDVQCEFADFLYERNKAVHPAFPSNPPHMRMPRHLEEEMIAKFDGYKRKFAIKLPS